MCDDNIKGLTLEFIKNRFKAISKKATDKKKMDSLSLEEKIDMIGENIKALELLLEMAKADKAKLQEK